MRCEQASNRAKRQITSSLVTFPLSFECKCRTVIPQVNQMDEQNVWRCHPHTHSLLWSVGGEEGVVAPSPLFFCPSIHPADTQEEWIIYNHFSSGLVWLMWQLATNSPNLVVCHCWEKSTCAGITQLPSSCRRYPCHNNMANESWTTQDNGASSHSTRLRLAKATRFLTVYDLHHISCFTVCVRWCVTGICPLNPLCGSVSFRQVMKKDFWDSYLCDSWLRKAANLQFTVTTV